MTIQELARYWAIDYDWRMRGEAERLLQFATEIDGAGICFIHVKSRHENALPLIITHGGPGSVTERQVLSQLGPRRRLRRRTSVLESNGLAASDAGWQELGDQLATQLSGRTARKESRA